jgi:OmpA-OmpF porin, OOP family
MSNPGDRWRRGWIPFLLIGLLLGGGLLAWSASDNDDLNTEVANKPSALSISAKAGQLVLRGQVPTEEDRERLVTAARSAPSEWGVVDELEVVSDATPVADTTGLFGELGSAQDWSVDIVGGKLTVRGFVASEASRAAILQSLRSAFGSTIKIDNQLVVRPTPSSGPSTAPATLPPTTVAATLPPTTAAQTTVAATTIAPTTIAATTIAATTVAPAAEETAVEAINEVIDLQPITFQTGSAQLTAEGRSTLDTVAETLAANPTVNIEIQGHTDNFGVPSENQTLSQARAETVRTYLIDNGIDADRMTAVGFGDTQPVADNTTSAGRAQNRRIEFQVAS